MARIKWLLSGIVMIGFTIVTNPYETRVQIDSVDTRSPYYFEHGCSGENCLRYSKLD